MSKLIRFTILLAASISLDVEAQVLDVNGDNIVGPHEAIALKELWKGTANSPNQHTHFGQVWSPSGNGIGLTIRGNFPDRNRVIIGPAKETKQGTGLIPGGALILDNTSPDDADLLLGGKGIIEAVDEPESELTLRANGDISVLLDADNNDGTKDFLVRRFDGISVFGITERGDFFYLGEPILQKDHPLDPKNKTLSHLGVCSSESLNIYSGNVVLGDKGESWVQLPSYFEAFNRDYRYTLTPIGGPAPNLYVAEKIQENRFRIAGGAPGQEISWQVSGVRDDPRTKANPIPVEEEKSGSGRGKFLHPEIYNADVE